MPRQTEAKRARSEIARAAGLERVHRPGPWHEMDSSRVARARYDSGARQLHVVFSNNGAPYIYEEVPPNIWRNFRRVSSPGKYINRVLNAHPYYRSPVDFDEMDEMLESVGDERAAEFDYGGEY